MRQAIILISLLIFSTLLVAQSGNEKRMVLQLKPCLHEQALSLNEEYKLNNETLTIETFKFYLGNISLRIKGESVWQEVHSYHLVDAADNASQNIILNVPALIEFDSIQFNLGIDSLTNVSGAMGGDLDPTKGMYWTWQSGYINFKLEGKSPACTARNNFFQFHLGGYLPPYASVQTVRVMAVRNDTVNVSVDVAMLLEKTDLATIHSIMSPGKESLRLSKLASTIFYCDEQE